MIVSLKKFSLILLLLVSTVTIAQDFEFTTKVSKNKLGINQRVRIEFTVNKNGADNFAAPDFTNFKVVAGPSSSVSQSWVNGKTSYSQSYTYVLEPKSKGNFTIPPASIEYNGKTIQSNSVKITVTDKVTVPKNPNDPHYIAQNNLFLVASVSKTNPYVGEPIYVEYRLYFNGNIGFYNAQFSEIPKYEGFWNQEITINKQEPKNGEYKGEQFHYYTLKKAILIPQKSGKLYINPIKMDILVEVPTGRYDFFGNALTRRVNTQYSSERRLVKVKALPVDSKPENFTGAVGNFSLDVNSSKSTLKANESTQINVKITGTGNLKLFEIPKINVPAELEVYTPERTQNVSTTLSGLKGSITDSYSIVPNFKGKYKIPPVSFSYFNPKDKQYHTLNSEPIILDVTAGKSLASTSDTAITKQFVKSSGGDFRFIHTDKLSFIETTSDFFKSPLFYTLLLIPFLIIPIGVLLGKHKRKIAADLVGNKIRKADKLAKKYLSEAKKQLGNKEAFYVALEKALHNFLKARLQIETSDISQEKITELLRTNKVSESAIEAFVEVLNNCDFARYTPTTNVMMKEEYNKANRVLHQINNELK
jgi:hypothetical protein